MMDAAAIQPPGAGRTIGTPIVFDVDDDDSPPRAIVKRAAAWSEFEELPDEEKVQCAHCGEKLVYKGGKTGTSSMGRHLETCKKKVRLEAGQKTLSFGVIKLPHAAKLKIHGMIERWMLRDQQSLSVLDHPDFKALLKTLQPDYDCPSRNVMTRKIGVDYGLLKTQVGAYLRSLPGRVALTTEGWTAGNGDQFLSLTAHFITTDWELQTMLLDFAPFPVPHSAENAANLITSALQDYGIEKKISACVTDNTASAYNISAILKRRAAPAPFFPSRCAAHLINLIVKHGLQDAGRDEIFAEPRAFVSLLHRSKPTEKALMAACESVGIKYTVPPTAMEVRWNSTLAQLLGLQRLEPALRHLFESGHSTSAWSEQVWLAMRDTIKILNGFKDVSDHLQGRSFPTISAAAEGYIIMSKGLEELRAASTLTPWGTEVLALFDTRLTEYREHLIDTFVVQWATILDPSMKAEVIRADGGNDLRYIISELEYHLSTNYPIVATNHHAPSSSSAPISAYEKRRQKFAAAAPAPITIDAGKQLELYLAEPPIPTPAPSDSLHYWSVNQCRFPSLAALARDLLAIPATSVPSEAAFSRGGEVITKRRNRPRERQSPTSCVSTLG